MFYLTETSALSNEANVLQFLKGALVAGLKNKNKQFVILTDGPRILHEITHRRIHPGNQACQP